MPPPQKKRKWVRFFSNHRWMLGLRCKFCLKNPPKKCRSLFQHSSLHSLFAFSRLCLHIYDGKHRDFISKRAAVGWCCCDIRAGVRSFLQKKTSKKKLQLFLAWICSQLSVFPFPTTESLNLFQKRTLRTACSASTPPSPSPLASHLAADRLSHGLEAANHL